MNSSKLLTNLVSVVGVAGVSLIITLPSVAREVRNSQPAISQQTSVKKVIAQGSSSGALNPRPSIFNEAPYNRGGSSTPVTPPPVTNPGTNETPGTEVPATETPTTTSPQTSDTQGKSLLAIAESNSSFTILTRALKAAGLTEVLQGKDNLTVFAPNDAAFGKLPKGALDELLKPENKEVLVKVLTYHVVPGSVLSTDLKAGVVKSVEGGDIVVKIDPANGVTVNDAKVIQADIKGSNGVIHVIDNVIIPPSL